jgi:hypothetical protein
MVWPFTKEKSASESYMDGLAKSQSNSHTMQQLIGVGDGQTIPAHAKDVFDRYGYDAAWKYHDDLTSGKVKDYDQYGNKLPGTGQGDIDRLKGPNPYVSGALGIGGLAVSAYSAKTQHDLAKEQIKGLKQNRQFAAENQARKRAVGDSWNAAWGN